MMNNIRRTSKPRALRLAQSALTIVLLTSAAALTGCADYPQNAGVAKAVPLAQLQFVDLQGFDRDLEASLAAPLPSVDVAFYDKVSPSAMPERLQKWMASVEAGGGSVKIVPPPSTVTAKNPFLIVSLANSLWNASKIAKAAAIAGHLKVAHPYNADILLKVDDRGDTVVDKVVFIQRKK
jgi:hypothetical protein